MFLVCIICLIFSEFIYCIVWVKMYFFGKLFGEDDEDMDIEELDKVKFSGENGKLIKIFVFNDVICLCLV